MRILERPIASAGLGIACAIVLLFLLSSSGSTLANTSQVPSAGAQYSSNLSKHDSVTNTVSSTTVVETYSSSNSYYMNTTQPQTVSTPTTMSSTASGLFSSSASSFFTFGSDNLVATSHRSEEFYTLATLAVLSLVVALGSMYFVKKRSAVNVPAIEATSS